MSPKQVVGFTFVFYSEVDQLIRKFIIRTLMSNGVLDENVAGYLMKATEDQAKAALACLGHPTRKGG